MSKKEKPSASAELRGTVLAFNLSPRGHIEGALVETATGLVQINFPKHHSEALAQSMHVGSTIAIDAELETNDGAHPIYRTSEKQGEASGTILRFNYTPDGEVNGYHLDEGTFVHVKPDGARKFRLDVGDKVKATGSRRPGANAMVLEADELEKMGVKRVEHGSR
jgi:ribosomal protein L31